MIQLNELETPHLNPVKKGSLLTAANSVMEGVAEVTVALTYSKQTDTKPRIAGEDYVAMPGVSPEAQSGRLLVMRRADNKANRRKGVVGKVYFKIRSVTRADGVEAFGYTNVRPEGITDFAILGTKLIPQEDRNGE